MAYRCMVNVSVPQAAQPLFLRLFIIIKKKCCMRASFFDGFPVVERARAIRIILGSLCI